MSFRKLHNFILRLESGIKGFTEQTEKHMKSYAIRRDAFTPWLVLVRLFDSQLGFGCHGNGKAHEQKDDVLRRRRGCRQAGRTTWECVCASDKKGRNRLKVQQFDERYRSQTQNPRRAEKPTSSRLFIRLLLSAGACDFSGFASSVFALMLRAVKVLRSAGLKHPVLFMEECTALVN